MQKAAIFDDIYRDYVNQVASLNLGPMAERLGIRVNGDTAHIPFFGKWFEVSPEGIVDEEGNRPSHSVSVVLCKYLLLCPSEEPVGDDWVTYRNFKDATPYVTGFDNTAIKPLAKLFSDRLPRLEQIAALITGRPTQVDVSCDLALEFDALPRIPLMLLFNDQDEDFPAECSIFFKSNAEKYLDMECLAILGMILPEWMKRLDVSA